MSEIFIENDFQFQIHIKLNFLEVVKSGKFFRRYTEAQRKQKKNCFPFTSMRLSGIFFLFSGKTRRAFFKECSDAFFEIG